MQSHIGNLLTAVRAVVDPHLIDKSYAGLGGGEGGGEGCGDGTGVQHKDGSVKSVRVVV